MSKEIRAVIDTIQTADSMKAVKVALGLSEANQESISKVMEVVSLMDKNMKFVIAVLVCLLASASFASPAREVTILV